MSKTRTSSITTEEIIAILDAKGINPMEEEEIEEKEELPGIGEIKDNEIIYETPLSNVLRQDTGGLDDGTFFDIWGLIELSGDLLSEIENCNEDIWKNRLAGTIKNAKEKSLRERELCAWYCPIHYYRYGWGIYIRQSCIISRMHSIFPYIAWHKIRYIAPMELLRQLYLSSFYLFFLHEQFHHKVESFGFRLLISKNKDCYTEYFKKVYRKTFNTKECLEEALANADSFRRLDERSYTTQIHREIRKGVKLYVRSTMPFEPDGYKEGMNYLDDDKNKKGLHKLQTQILEKKIKKFKMNMDHWSLAPKMITSLKSIDTKIYTIIPAGGRSIVKSKHLAPAATASSDKLSKALIRHYDYKEVPGGKGSHKKLKKAGFPTIVMPGNMKTVSPGIIKHVLNIFGGHPISKLPELLEGNLK